MRWDGYSFGPPVAGDAAARMVGDFDLIVIVAAEQMHVVRVLAQEKRLSGLMRQNVTMQPTIGCVLLKFVLCSKLRAAGERVPSTPTLSSIALAKIAHQGSPNEPVLASEMNCSMPRLLPVS